MKQDASHGKFYLLKGRERYMNDMIGQHKECGKNIFVTNILKKNYICQDIIGNYRDSFFLIYASKFKPLRWLACRLIRASGIIIIIVKQKPICSYKAELLGLHHLKYDL